MLLLLMMMMVMMVMMMRMMVLMVTMPMTNRRARTTTRCAREIFSSPLSSSSLRPDKHRWAGVHQIMGCSSRIRWIYRKELC